MASTGQMDLILGQIAKYSAAIGFYERSDRTWTCYVGESSYGAKRIKARGKKPSQAAELCLQKIMKVTQ